MTPKKFRLPKPPVINTGIAGNKKEHLISCTIRLWILEHRQTGWEVKKLGLWKRIFTGNIVKYIKPIEKQEEALQQIHLQVTQAQFDWIKRNRELIVQIFSHGANVTKAELIIKED